MAYEDVISQSLDAATPISSSINYDVVEHTDVDGFEEKVKQFREQMATNATLDYRDARGNIRNLIGGAMEIFPDVLAAVEDTRSDKAIIALNGFLKTVTEMNEKLVDLNSTVTKDKAIKGVNKQEESQPSGNQIVVINNESDPTKIYSQSVTPVEDRFNKD